MTSVPPNAADQARALFGDFIRGRWGGAHEQFDENLRGHVDAAQVARGWAQLAGSVGGLEQIGEPSTCQSGDYRLVEVPLTFERSEGVGRVALDRDGKVAGLSVQYPRRRRLDPRPVRVFTLGWPVGLPSTLRP